MKGLEIEFLGTGTSTGVPQIKCSCQVCCSDDARDKRLRSSVIVRHKGKNLLIDCGPDFRTQILNASNNNLDALLISHIHYDHVGGIDDLRAYCSPEKPFPLYARQDVVNALKAHMPYCFSDSPYPGVPSFDITVIDNKAFLVGEVEILPLEVMHANLPILGFKIANMAYITDASYISSKTMQQLHNLDLLVINALRTEPHHSHFSLEETLTIIRKLTPQRAILTHMSHGIGLHEKVNKKLPQNVELAHDGLIVSI
ncbi:MAG: MBL fold metallo-hydrolase [Bacteroidales bacterium]|nr:MBL fold metallo-hydrolase [Candidatus Sodaliphilus aphodohippi]